MKAGAMRAVLDACVLYPTVMRELFLAAAEAGLFEPIWSPRILEEWARAVGRDGAEAEARERALIASLAVRFPRASVAPGQGVEARLWLPDPGDVHVLATAVSAHADLIVTQNARDFPRMVLGDEGVARADPDGFLLGLFEAHPGIIAPAAEAVRARAHADLGGEWPLRKLMKKARLPRLGKALERAAAERDL